MKPKILNNVRIVDPSSSADFVGSVVIEKGRIKEINEGTEVNKDSTEYEVYNLEGKVLAPGFIDMHVHLREPGFEAKETIESGTKAAVKGGFTSVCAMPNTDPPADKAATVKYIIEKAKEADNCHVLPIGCITKERKGEKIAEYGELKESGVVGLSDDGDTVMNSLVMRRSLEYAKNYDLPVLTHCEDEALVSKGQINEGYYSTILGLKGMPNEAEDIIVDRDIKLAALTGARLHICHISTREGVELIRKAKDKGLLVTAEVCPHHFSLTHEAVVSFDTSTKVKPPLRSEDDVEAIIEGLKDGIFDIIASDHAPHARHEKEVEYDYAPFGISGIETALPVTFTYLYHQKSLSLEQIIEKYTVNPAKALGLNIPSIEVGAVADLTVIDLDETKEVIKEDLTSIGKNNPYIGKELKGWPVMTMVEGEIKYIDEEVNKNAKD
ncbi:dihydroorotase [Natranaerofaba carboxydovora]|uniref:dihydroorotase n=1 Tax=Natranaerofaba carboxydovora TaxID=2742683 RepID=UPI001F12CF9A|nr:dihydroorotase [Natranaerofaba carboxydovora]UMZ73874.1 Dihydroorotase [Natranaerofaba carboxydovora]